MPRPVRRHLKPHQTPRRPRLPVSGFVLGACLLAGLSPEAAAERAPLAYGLAWGSASEDTDAWRASVSRDWQRRWFERERARLTGYWELSAARFANSVVAQPTDNGTGTLWNVAIAPVLRLELGPWGEAGVRPFLDLGVGLSLMSHRNLRTGKPRSRPLGSLFQFEDRGAVGVRIGRLEVAYQRMHYSNLDLASENFGVDAHLLQLRVRSSR
ncbi:MAG: acyloxyacyl hydrolase [Pseudomonadota bacterium]